QIVRDNRDVVDVYRHVFRIESPSGIDMAISVHRVPLLKTCHPAPHRHYRARALETNHIGKYRLVAIALVEKLTKGTLSLPGVPYPDANRFETNQYFVGPNIGHGEPLPLERSTKSTNGRGVHHVWYQLCHGNLKSIGKLNQQTIRRRINPIYD